MNRQETCAERIGPYMQGRAESAQELFAIIDNDTPAEVEGYEVTPDDAYERISEWPLSVERVTHVKITLGTGGPGDWLDAEMRDGAIIGLTYHFADWFDHASVPVEESSPLWRLAEYFTEAME